MSKLQQKGINPDLELSDKSFMFFDRKFHFWTDCAASPNNSKCQRLISPKKNYFFTELPKSGSLYLHPPYQLGTELWLELLDRHVSKTHQLAVVFLPWDEEAFWYKKYATRADVAIIPQLGLEFNKPVPCDYILLCFNLYCISK